MATRTPLRVVPETRTLTLETENGLLDLTVYPKGPTTPVSVMIAEDAAWAEWNDATPSAEDRQALSPRRYVLRANKAEYQWRIDLLRAMTNNQMTEEHASVLVGDDGPWRDLLVEYGYLSPLPASDEVTDDPQPSGESDTSTGETASPDSAPTTQDTTP